MLTLYTDDPYKRSSSLYKDQKNIQPEHKLFFHRLKRKWRRLGEGSVDLNFTSQEEKDAFVGRLQRVKQSLRPEGSARMDNISKFSVLMDMVEWGSRSSPQQAAAAASSQFFLSNSGKCTCPCTTDHTNSGLLLCVGIYTGDVSSKEVGLFVAERGCFSNLLQGLYTPCSCGLTFNPWRVGGGLMASINRC